ncbi:MAG: DNA-binding protein [Proteobacteria bacterium]|nr:DNA-binding protein [Pseudomonadota bacterium]
MRNILNVLFIALALTACQKETPQDTAPIESNVGVPAAEGGTVVTTMDAGGYTYVELESNGSKFWAAGPSIKVKVGDKVTLGPGSIMQNFQSKSLDRTFESILFTGAIIIDAAGQASGGQSAGGGAASAEAAAPAKGDIAKAEGGYTVEEVFTKKAELGGKTISVKGKIVKASGFIMNANWYHIQDGTGAEGANDLVVTSQDTIEAGSIVVAKGPLTLNKDFGSGYKFDLIMEEAKLVAE